MNSIILIAPPAGGKGTQANLIKNEYHIPHISTGDLLRGASNDTGSKSLLIKELQKKGELVPDEIVLELLEERINESDCNNGYILDGFPRNLNQAYAYEEMLKKNNKELGIVVLLNLDKEIAKQRVINRYTCPDCGTVYNSVIEELMPKNQGKCDVCNGPLVHRSDDTEETYDKRYIEYLDKTAPLIEYYREKNVLYEIDSSIGKIKTFEEIKKILGSNI